MNIYGYTSDSTGAPIKRLPWKPPAIPSTPWIPRDPPLEAKSVVLGFLPARLQIRFYLNPEPLQQWRRDGREADRSHAPYVHMAILVHVLSTLGVEQTIEGTLK